MIDRSLIATVLVAGMVLWAGCSGIAEEEGDARGGFIEADEIESAPENATVVPIWNESVRNSEPVLRAVENATRDENGSAVEGFDAEEQDAVEGVGAALPQGPEYDSGGARGLYYVRVGDDVVTFRVAYYD